MFDWLSPGLTPFENLSWFAISMVALAHAAGCFIRGAFGFGSNMPIVVATTFILGPHHAILLALMTTIVAQLHLLPSGFKTADWQVTKPLILGMTAGTLFGTWVFTILSGVALQIILGSLIVLIILMDAIKLVERLLENMDVRSKAITGGFSVVGGIMGGLSGAGAFYFLVVYLKHACPTPEALRGTNVILSAMTMFMRAFALATAGLITPMLMLEGLVLAPIVYLATWLGAHAFKVTSDRRFYVALQILLLAGAAVLVFKGARQLISV
ncbi:MAG: hypothetical protein CMM52_10695 [Rhodospirillaceae bacterium]|nr:hypothetical protein [Rhodospirillaceae bacterium]|tara:strand:- start:24629 stop:25435 length:807 start_codon:yes stop_codon:yes gene_type:complete